MSQELPVRWKRVPTKATTEWKNRLSDIGYTNNTVIDQVLAAAPTEPSKPVAPPEREAPSIGQIIEVAESWQRGFMCPLCGHDQPHEHSPREITIYRNGVKWGLKNGTEQWPWKGYPSPSKNAGHDSKGVGRQGGHGTDQHHQHRVGQSGSDREVNELDSQGDGVHGAPCVSTQPEPYGQVTTHRVTGQQFFYRWPEPPYLDNASACVTVYAAALKSMTPPAQVAQDKEHAELYRWLRDQNWENNTLCVVVSPKDQVKLGTYCPTGIYLDHLIRKQIDSKKD